MKIDTLHCRTKCPRQAILSG
ncbi:hypothetical protein R2601_03413 [Salipiger bermudensis HTCC2601]|uniref:Uncharacterized protein n=1 Tax=Salipiger bermudensis (strain DSM 26914 / JCM 13377 / KCTC 12554 / HTCC2601) TaxID=314265 RepID=Q0FWG3_SALBH|nr:hypothetical protein R2601_03413 [Salipiger bermudensis HTCC2601]